MQFLTIKDHTTLLEIFLKELGLIEDFECSVFICLKEMQRNISL